MDAYKKFFYNSEKFFLLRTTGWIVGFLTAVVFALLWRPAVALYAGIATSIIVDIYLFIHKGLKESSFISPEILQLMSNIPSEKRDKYSYIITIVKPIALIVTTTFTIRFSGYEEIFLGLMVSAILYLILMCLFIAPKIAYFCGVMTPIETTESKIPLFYGVPGYNIQGVYTGSPTAIGGCSN